MFGPEELGIVNWPPSFRIGGNPPLRPLNRISFERFIGSCVAPCCSGVGDTPSRQRFEPLRTEWSSETGLRSLPAHASDVPFWHLKWHLFYLERSTFAQPASQRGRRNEHNQCVNDYRRYGCTRRKIELTATFNPSASACRLHRLSPRPLPPPPFSDTTAASFLKQCWQ